MKSSPLSPGDKPLRRFTPLRQSSELGSKSGRKIGNSPKKPKGFSPASNAQRAATGVCIVTACRRDEGWTIDPAHLAARGGRGVGCDHELCTVGLRRDVHEAFDRGDFDLLPYLLANKMIDQIAHALIHYEGDLLGLAHRLTGERFVPAVELAA